MTAVERMMDKVIEKFGFEVEETIEFCELCEREDSTIGEIQEQFNWLMEM